MRENEREMDGRVTSEQRKRLVKLRWEDCIVEYKKQERRVAEDKALEGTT